MIKQYLHLHGQIPEDFFKTCDNNYDIIVTFVVIFVIIVIIFVIIIIIIIIIIISSSSSSGSSRSSSSNSKSNSYRIVIITILNKHLVENQVGGKWYISETFLLKALQSQKVKCIDTYEIV